jgi:two-component sensor histidine kinase
MVSAIRMTSRWPRAVQLLCAALGTVACFLIQLPIESRSVGDPFAIFVCCAFIIALLFGRLAGGVTVVLSSALATLFFEPLWTFKILHATDLIQLQIYIVLSLAAVVFANQIRCTLIAQSNYNAAITTEDRRKALRLKELSHRVANNFSSLDALIRLRARSASDPKIAFAFEQASELVHVVARLTNRLTASDNVSVVGTRAFVREVCEDLKACAPTWVKIEYEAEHHELPLNAAIPCGLMINELVTNALKYAFPGGAPRAERHETECRINIMFRAEGDRYTLVVADNGIGLPAGLDWSATKTLGLQLINILARHQLGGQVEVDSRAGTSFKITFTEREYTRT